MTAPTTARRSTTRCRSSGSRSGHPQYRVARSLHRQRPDEDADALAVTVSYYDREAKSKDGEQTPVYAMSFELFENGVSRALVLDYNDFVISGAMASSTSRIPSRVNNFQSAALS